MLDPWMGAWVHGRLDNAGHVLRVDETPTHRQQAGDACTGKCRYQSESASAGVVLVVIWVGYGVMKRR